MWIKICGFTDPANAVDALAVLPDAIGLNFYPASKRYVSPVVARRIADAIPAGIECVGVFVNSPAAQVAEIVETAKLSMIQLHGDETPDLIAEVHRRCPAVPIVRAVRVGANGPASLNLHIAEVLERGVSLFAVLVDALVPGSYGGTGHAVDAEWLANYDPTLPPVILAGGLKPENVAAAVAAIQPMGVDTASGVESAPGVKDPELVARFIAEARGTDSNLH